MLLPYSWSAYFHSAQHLRVWNPYYGWMDGMDLWVGWVWHRVPCGGNNKNVKQKRSQNMMYSCYNGGCHPSFVSVAHLFHFWKESPNGHIECASVKLQNNYTNTLFWSVFNFFFHENLQNHCSSFVLTIPTIIGRGKLPLNVNRLKTGRLAKQR